MPVIILILQISTKALRNSGIADSHPADWQNSRSPPRGIPGPSGDPRNPLDPPRGGSLSSPFSAPLPTPRSFLRSRPLLPEAPRLGMGTPAGGACCPRRRWDLGVGGCRDNPTYFDREAGRPQLAGPQPCLCRQSVFGTAAARDLDSSRDDTLRGRPHQRPAAARPAGTPDPLSPSRSPSAPPWRAHSFAAEHGQGRGGGARRRHSPRREPAQAQCGPKCKKGRRAKLVAPSAPPPLKPC